MRKRSLYYILPVFILTSCAKESEKRSEIKKLLFKVENYRIGTKGKSEVSYFTYDLLQRPISVHTFKIDSSGNELDSTLIESIKFNYLDTLDHPAYKETYQLLPAGGISIKTFFLYENGKLIGDSSYGDYVKPIPKSPATINIRSYSYADPLIICSNKRFEKTIWIDKDTTVIADGNVRSNLYDHCDKKGKSTGVGSKTSYAYDHKINPLTFPWSRHTRYSGNHINRNNVIIMNYRSNDSMSVISRFIYDEDDYPSIEYYTVKQYFPPKATGRYIRRYYYGE